MDNDQKDVVHGTLVTYGDVCDVRFVFVGVKTFGPPSSSSSDEMIIIGLSIDKESGQLLLDLDRFVSDGTWHSPSLRRRKDLVFHSTFHSIPRFAPYLMARRAKQGLDNNSHLGICIYVCFTTGTVDPQVYPILTYPTFKMKRK